VAGVSEVEVFLSKKNSKPRLVAVLHRAHGAGAAPSRIPGYKLQTALWHKLQIIDDKLQTALQYKLQIIDGRRAQQLHQAVRLTAACLHFIADDEREITRHLD
jgi:hypothetical protein